MFSLRTGESGNELDTARTVDIRGSQKESRSKVDRAGTADSVDNGGIATTPNVLDAPVAVYNGDKDDTGNTAEKTRAPA